NAPSVRTSLSSVKRCSVPLCAQGQEHLLTEDNDVLTLGALPLGGSCAGTVAKLSGCNSGCHAGGGAGVCLAFGSAGCGPASPKRLGRLGRSGDRRHHF